MTESELKTQLDNLKSSLEEARKPFEAAIQENIEYTYPILGKYLDTQWEDKRYDSSATMSGELMADGMYGSMCAPSLNWFSYAFDDDELNDTDQYAEWLDEVEQHMYEVLTSRSNFYPETPKILKQGVFVGTVPIDHEVTTNGEQLIVASHPMENYLALNRNRQIDTRLRVFPITADQAREEFGKDNLPKTVKQALRSQPYKEFTFEHFMMPRRALEDNAVGKKAKPFVGYVRLEGDETIIKEYGYDVLPGMNWLFAQRGNDPYGYCPTHNAMPDIITLNQMIRTLLQYGERIADPPSWLPYERMNANLSPGGRNTYVDPGRVGMFQQLPGGFPVDWEMVQYFQERIKEQYKVNHFLMLMAADSNKQMTAREILERKSEKLSVTGSTIGRFERDYLSKVHRLMLGKELELGRLPPPPEGAEFLLKAPLKIDYQGPLAQAQKEQQTVQGIINVVEYALALAQLDPTIVKKLKAEYLLEEVLEVYGTPEKAIVGEKQFRAIKQKMEAQAEAMAKAQTMAEAGKGAQGMAKAAAEAAQGGV